MYSHFVMRRLYRPHVPRRLARVTPRDVLDRPGREPDAVLRYADRDEGVVDVFTPSASSVSFDRPHPLVVFLHGGFWRQEWDRTHVRPLAHDLAGRGLVVAVPEYRRVGGSGGWPRTGDDVEQAVGALPALLEAWRPGLVDAEAPFVLSGHSAGGHLALWSGLRAAPGSVKRVVALAPVSDLVRAAEGRLGDDATHALLGGSPADVPAAYAAADPLALIASTATPVTILQGDADAQVPVWLNRAVARRMIANGRPYFRYEELDGVDHFALIDPEAEVWKTVVRALVDDG